jgi:hypothetical protein
MLFYCVVHSEGYLHVGVPEEFCDGSDAGSGVCKSDPFFFMSYVPLGGPLTLGLGGISIIFQYLGYDFLFFVSVFFGELLGVYSIV